MTSERFRVGEVCAEPLTVPEAIRPEEAESQTAGEFFAELLRRHGKQPRDKDILVVSSKVAAFYEGRSIRLDDVRPSRKARWLGRAFGKDPRKVELILRTGKVVAVIPMKRIIRIPSVWRMMVARSPNPEAMRRGYEQINGYVFVVRAHAALLDDAGIDHTNSPDGYVTLLPEDPCATAAQIREAVAEAFGADVAVIVTDTVSCVGRLGSQDVAIGYAGIDPVTRESFSDDLFGVPRSGGLDIVVDSIAGIAGLVMGQTTERTPAVLVRGVHYLPERADEAPGMAALRYPVDAERRMALTTAAATARLHLINLLTFSSRPRKG
jgi:coenzyme F420-0:L-glutamate ligase/coenzyme F420-1:gamma-L-glutamate ligase